VSSKNFEESSHWSSWTSSRESFDVRDVEGNGEGKGVEIPSHLYPLPSGRGIKRKGKIQTLPQLKGIKIPLSPPFTKGGVRGIVRNCVLQGAFPPFAGCTPAIIFY